MPKMAHCTKLKSILFKLNHLHKRFFSIPSTYIVSATQRNVKSMFRRKEHLGSFLCSLADNVPLFVQLNRYSQLTALSDVFHPRGPTECAVLKMWKRCSNPNLIPNLIPLLYLCQRKQVLYQHQSDQAKIVVSRAVAQFQQFFVLHFIPALGVMCSSPDIAEEITERVILAAGFFQSSLWRGLAKFFDFDRIR